MKMEKTNKHYYLFTDGIGVFKNEKPNVNDFKSSPFCESGLCKAYYDCIKDWLQSGEKYPFGEGEEEKFREFVSDLINSKTDNIDLKSGILISPDRVEFMSPFGYDKPVLAFFVPIEEDKKYPIGGYAPGFYSCTCCICKKEFQGDKRAVQCEPCAIKMVEEDKPKEESQDEIWKELIDLIYVLENESEGYSYMVNRLKEKYNTPTRK